MVIRRLHWLASLREAVGRDATQSPRGGGLIRMADLSSSYFTAFLWPFDHSIPCHVMMIRDTATHLMFLFVVRK